MGSYDNNFSTALEEFSNILRNQVDKEMMDKLNSMLKQFSSILKKSTTGVPFQFLSEEMKNYISEAQKSEKLSQAEFEAKYSHEMDICKQLGQAGWVVSEHSNHRIISEWFDILSQGKTDDIVSYFEGDKGSMPHNILRKQEQVYCEEPFRKYFYNGKDSFENGDYMTSAMYLVALVNARVDYLMKYPPKTKYREKYSIKGFQTHLHTEFNKTSSFITKRFLFLDIYPSIIEFLSRLFIDGKYTFEKEIEPPYINRNWLMHGRSTRVIERYECIQLFNALSAIEFVFSISDKLNKEIDK